jgi:hypothetical protein
LSRIIYASLKRHFFRIVNLFLLGTSSRRTAKLDAIKNNVRGIDFPAVLVRVAARLYAPFAQDFLSLREILCQKLRRIAPCRARNKIRLAFLSGFRVAVNGNCYPRKRLPALRCFYVGILRDAPV